MSGPPGQRGEFFAVEKHPVAVDSDLVGGERNHRTVAGALHCDRAVTDRGDAPPGDVGRGVRRRDAATATPAGKPPARDSSQDEREQDEATVGSGHVVLRASCPSRGRGPPAPCGKAEAGERQQPAGGRLRAVGGTAVAQRRDFLLRELVVEDSYV